MAVPSFVLLRVWWGSSANDEICVFFLTENKFEIRMSKFETISNDSNPKFKTIRKSTVSYIAATASLKFRTFQRLIFGFISNFVLRAFCFVFSSGSSGLGFSVPKKVDTKDQADQKTAHGKQITVRCIEGLLVHHGHGARSNGLLIQRCFV